MSEPANDPLPIVTVERPRCPECKSLRVYCRSSKGDQGDGSIMRYAGCRDCDTHFILWLE